MVHLKNCYSASKGRKFCHRPQVKKLGDTTGSGRSQPQRISGMYFHLSELFRAVKFIEMQGRTVVLKAWDGCRIGSQLMGIESPLGKRRKSWSCVVVVAEQHSECTSGHGTCASPWFAEWACSKQHCLAHPRTLFSAWLESRFQLQFPSNMRHLVMAQILRFPSST